MGRGEWVDKSIKLFKVIKVVIREMWNSDIINNNWENEKGSKGWCGFYIFRIL